MLQLIDRQTEDDPINTLCVSTNGQYEIVSFKDAKPLFSHMNGLHAFTTQHKNYLFDQFWKSKVAEVCKTNDTITVEQIVTLIWDPVLCNINNFLMSLQNAEIELVELNSLLKEPYSKQLGLLSPDLQKLSAGLSYCHKAKEDLSWIAKATGHINNYWKLCTYSGPAKVFLAFRDDLELTGDFKIVEKIAEGVR